MKNYISKEDKPWVIVTKNGKIVHKAKVRVGGYVVTPDTVEWFATEEDWKAKVDELTPKK
jgi:hypothetical protein